MNSIDLAPLYRSSVGFDRLASLLNNAYNSDSAGGSYPPYNIEVLDEKSYAVTLALAGFESNELDIQVEKGVLTVKGHKAQDVKREFLHQGIPNRTFERKFNLADHVEVTSADFKNGLLTINLVKEIPEAMKPKQIKISSATHQEKAIEGSVESANESHAA